MSGILRLEAMFPKRSGTELAAAFPSTANSNARRTLAALVTMLHGVMDGVYGARIRLSSDESTPVAASGTVTLTQASLTAGDAVYINGYALTAVAGTATAASGTWSKDTSSTAAATSLAAAINAYEPVRQFVTATSSSAVVTITAREAGAVGNSISLLELDAGGGIARSGSTLSGGTNAGALVSVNGTFSNVGTANETISIGGVTLTLKASASTESEITIGASAAATATNTISKINAHSKLKGLVLASSGGSGVVTVQLLSGGRVGNLVTLADTSAVFAWASSSFAPSTTEAWASSPVVLNLGAPST